MQQLVRAQDGVLISSSPANRGLDKAYICCTKSARYVLSGRLEHKTILEESKYTLRKNSSRNVVSPAFCSVQFSHFFYNIKLACWVLSKKNIP